MEVEKRRYVGIELGKRTYEMAIVGKNVSVKKHDFNSQSSPRRQRAVSQKKCPVVGGDNAILHGRFYQCVNTAGTFRPTV